MKRAILIILVLAVAIGAFFWYLDVQYVNKLKKYNLTRPERRIVEAEGKEYHVLVYKYNPPYPTLSKGLLKEKNEVDYSMPEDTNLALWSAVGRNREWYVSLFDERSSKNLLKKDRESGGRILEEYNKDKPLVPAEGDYEALLYKVELEYNNKKYAIIQIKDIMWGEEFPRPSYAAFVKDNKKWLWTEDIDKHPVQHIVGLKSYDEFLNLSKKKSNRVLVGVIIIIASSLLVIFILVKTANKLRKKAINT